jgi:hypothetical protein
LYLEEKLGKAERKAEPREDFMEGLVLKGFSV